MSVWESYIINGVNLYIKIEWSDDITEDIQTIVRYTKKDNIIYPIALNVYLDRLNNRSNTYPDGIIKINSQTDWDYALRDNISPNGKNLALGLMRSMARIMGFGSNVYMTDSGEYYFSDKRYHTLFNTLVSNSSNIFLNSIDVNKGMPNPQLKSYIEDVNQSFWVSTNNAKYKLASPPFSNDNPPFVYIELDGNNTSLMSSSLSAGNYILQLDETTQDILNKLGWNTQLPSPIKIIGDSVPETGLVSAYESHRFIIDKKDIPITNPRWFLKIQKTNSEIDSIALHDDNLACTINPIATDLYKVNSDGDIEAQLYFYGISNGQEIKAPPFKIFFELKPLIEYAKILSIHDNAPFTSYDAKYEVKYLGAEKIKVSVEEEYGAIIKSTYINEPYLAYGTASNITSPYYAWIDFIAENKYGKSTYTIEMQPYGATNAETSLDLYNQNEIIEIYTIDGIMIGSFNSISEFKRIQYKGVFLLKHIVNNSIVRTSKIICK